MGQLQSVPVAMFALPSGSGRAEEEELLPVAGAGAAKGCRMLQKGEGYICNMVRGFYITC